MKTNNLITFLFVSFLLFSFSAMSTGCMELCDGIDGNGNVVKENRTVTSFSGIDIGGAFEVVLIQGTDEALVLEADENLMEHIITEVKSGVLVIKTDKNIRNCEEMKAYITFKELDYMDLSGAIDIYSEGTLTFDQLEMDASGASEIELEMKANTFSLDVSGASEIKLSGFAETVSIDASGASEINAGEFEIDYLTLDVSGASEATVFVNKELDVDVSGAADVRYKGNPEKINTSTSGAGNLKKL